MERGRVFAAAIVIAFTLLPDLALAQTIGLSNSIVGPPIQGIVVNGREKSVQALFQNLASHGAQVLANPALEDPFDDCNKFRNTDGLMHFVGSTLLTLGFQYIYEEKFGLNKNLAGFLAAGSAAGVGVVKELYDDSLEFNCFSSADLFMNGVGILAGLTIVFVF